MQSDIGDLLERLRKKQKRRSYDIGRELPEVIGMSDRILILKTALSRRESAGAKIRPNVDSLYYLRGADIEKEARAKAKTIKNGLPFIGLISVIMILEMIASKGSYRPPETYRRWSTRYFV